ncbi:MAG: diguanylate cyclase [Acidimicrobiales bacterium]|nr:diguanylate cyclase [Acidimicrobiales bacterium]
MSPAGDGHPGGESTLDAFGAAVVTPPRHGPSVPVPDLSVNGNGRRPALHVGAEHPVDVLAVLDRRGRITFLSPSAERVLGLDVARTVGSQALRLFDDESAPLARALFADLVMGRRLTVLLEVRSERPDGVVVDLELVAAGQLQPHGGVVISMRDRVSPPPSDEHRPTDARGEEASELELSVPPSRRVGRRRRERSPTRPADTRGADHWQATVLESLAEGVMILDRRGTVRQVNEAFEVMFEAPRVRVVGHRLRELMATGRELGVEIGGEDGLGGPITNPLTRAMQTGRRHVDTLFRVQRPGRPLLWVRASAQPLFDDEGRVAGVVASFSDVTAVRQASRQLRREERFSQVLLDTLDEGIIACDADGRLTVFNPAARRLHGLDEWVDPTGSRVLEGWFRSPDGHALGAGEHPLLRALAGEQLRDVELLLDGDDGTTCKVLVNGEALVDDAGRRLGAVIAVHDVTEQKRNEERLAELALHDPLTSLANRTLLAERLQDAIDGLARRTLEAGPGGLPDGEPGVAVYLLDLDDFKEINDVLGHDVGDEVLVAVGRRLSAIVRPSDTVARLGGDEFVVLCAVEGGEEEMERIGDRIAEALARPYRIEGRTLTVMASVGGVFAGNPDTDPSKLLSRADDAMYGVKWSRRRQRRSMTD